MPNRTLKKRTFIGLFIGLALIGAVNLFGTQLKNTFYRLSYPLQRVFFGWGKGSVDFFAGMFQGKQLRQEIADLRTQNQGLLSQVSELDRLQKENAFLRSLLNTGVQRDIKFIVVTITSHDIGQDSLLVDRGSADGIAKDMVAITAQRVLVGKVSEVFTDFSRIQLISDKKSVFDATVQGKEIAGVIKGQGNGQLLFDLIPRTSEIAARDQVISSGLSKIFPAGLLIGKVQDVRKSDLEAYQNATLKLDFNETITDQLLIITGISNAAPH